MRCAACKARVLTVSVKVNAMHLMRMRFQFARKAVDKGRWPLTPRSSGLAGREGPMRLITILAVSLCVAVLAGVFPPDLAVFGVPYTVVVALVAATGFVYVLSRD